MLDSTTQKILLDSKNIAIVGLSPDSSKDSNKVGVYLQQRGYHIIPIYPKGERILGEVVYKSLSEAAANECVDIIVVFRKSEAVGAITREFAELISTNEDLKNGVKLFWLQLGIESAEARDIVESCNIKFVENKCIKIELQDL